MNNVVLLTCGSVAHVKLHDIDCVSSEGPLHLLRYAHALRGDAEAAVADVAVVPAVR